MAQTEGTVSYVEQVNIYNLWFGADDEESESEAEDWGWDYTEWMPEWHHTYKFLHFSGTESLYQADDSASAAFNEQAYAKIREAWGDYYWEEPDERIYMNTETSEFIQNKDLMGKEFLIVDSIPKLEWKMTGEQGTVLGYMCMKATSTIDTVNFEAWFTMEIPVSQGPYGMSGLPGLILKAQSDDGNFFIIAQSINFNTLEEGLLVAPKGGKKVTADEFEQIAKEKYEEMEKSGGGNWYGY